MGTKFNGRMRKKTLFSVFIMVLSLTSLILMVGFVFALTNLNLNSNIEIEYDGLVNTEVAGLYNASGELTATWDQLVSQSTIVLDGTEIVSVNINDINGHLVIQDGISDINASDFENCTGLLSIYFPASMNTISSSFRGCSNLTKVYFAQTENWYSVEVAGEAQYENVKVDSEILNNPTDAAAAIKNISIAWVTQ